MAAYDSTNTKMFAAVALRRERVARHDFAVDVPRAVSQGNAFANSLKTHIAIMKCSCVLLIEKDVFKIEDFSYVT